MAEDLEEITGNEGGGLISFYALRQAFQNIGIRIRKRLISLGRGTLETNHTGIRIVLNGVDNKVEFYNATSKIAEIDPAIEGNDQGIYLRTFRPGGAEGPHIRITSDETNLQNNIRIRVGGAVNLLAGLDIDFSDADDYATYDFNSGYFDSDLDPLGAGTEDLGNSTHYWGAINYKTLTDRGCLGYYDEGVELLNGKKVSDIEALKSIKFHPTFKTPAGVARLDYRTMPKDVYKPATIKKEDGTEELLPRDENDIPYTLNKKGEKVIAQDGAETTALISIMLGAIKELSGKIDDLEKKLSNNKK